MVGGPGHGNVPSAKRVTQAERNAIGHVAVWRTDRFVKLLAVESDTRDLLHEFSGRRFSRYAYGEYKEAKTNRCLPGLASKADITFRNPLREMDTSEEEAEERLILSDAVKQTKHLDKSPEPTLLQKLLTEPLQAYALKDSSFFIWPAHSPSRVFMYNLVKHRYFEAVIIFIILGNCAVLALEDQIDYASEHDIPGLADNIDIFFTVAFTIEALLKIFAMGFIGHRGAYLRDSWNILDAFILFLAYLNFAMSSGSNLSALRTLRVLRPLRSMNAVKGLKILVRSLIASVAALAPVFVMALFILFLGAVLSVQLFAGSFRFSCVDIYTGKTGNPCKPGVFGETYFGAGCGETETCTEIGNPGYGFYHFDNTLTALLVMFGFTSFDSWTTVANTAMATVGTLTFAFFFIFVFICGFIIPNLIFAALNTEYSRAQERDRQYDIRHAARVRRLVQQRTNMFKIMDSAAAMRVSYKKWKEEEEKEKQIMMQTITFGPNGMMASPLNMLNLMNPNASASSWQVFHENNNNNNNNEHNMDMTFRLDDGDNNNEDSNNNNQYNSSTLSTPRSQGGSTRVPLHTVSGAQSVKQAMSKQHNNPNRPRSILEQEMITMAQQQQNQHKQQQHHQQIQMRNNNESRTSTPAAGTNYNHHSNNTAGGGGGTSSPNYITSPTLSSQNNNTKTQFYIEDPTQPMEHLFRAPKPAIPASRGPEMNPMWVEYDANGNEIVPVANNNNNSSTNDGSASPEQRKPRALIMVNKEDEARARSKKSKKNIKKDQQQQPSSSTDGGGNNAITAGADNATSTNNNNNTTSKSEHQQQRDVEWVAPPINNNGLHSKQSQLDEDSWEYKWKMLRKKWNYIRDLCHEITEGYERSVAGKLALVSGGESDFSEISSEDEDEDEENKKSEKQEEGSSQQNVAAAESGETQSQSTFSLIIVTFIVLNTAVLATQYYDQPQWLEDAQKDANLVFTAVFAIEFVMRLMSLGFAKYYASSFNVLDFSIVSFSFMELGLEGVSIVSVFRALRLLRVLKLLKQFPSIRALIRVAFAAVGDSSYLMLIILLYLFIFALVGKAFFEDAVTDPNARMTFKTFVRAFFACFQTLTGDLWVNTMYDVMAHSHPLAAFYFIAQIVIGLFVLLALFLSILVETFSQMEQRSQFEIQDQVDEANNPSNMFKQNMLDSEVVRKIYAYGHDDDNEDDDNNNKNEKDSNNKNINNLNNNNNKSEKKKNNNNNEDGEHQHQRKKPVTGSAMALRRKSLERNNLSTDLLKEFERAKKFESTQDAMVARQLRERRGEMAMAARMENALFADQTPEMAGDGNKDSLGDFVFPIPKPKKEQSQQRVDEELEGFLAPDGVANNIIINIESEDSGPFRNQVPKINNNNNNKNKYSAVDDCVDCENNNHSSASASPTKNNNNNNNNGSAEFHHDDGLPELGAVIENGIRVSEVRSLPNNNIALNNAARLKEYLDGMYRPGRGFAGKWGTLGCDWPPAESLLPTEFREHRLNRKMSQNAFFAPAPRHIRDIVPAIILFHEGPLPPDPPPKERHVVCPNCGDKYKTSLPPAPLMAAPDPATYHQLQCRRIRIRKTKERILREMLSIINFYKSSGEETSIEKIESMLRQCWECLTLKAISVEYILESDDPWSTFAAEIEEQLQVLDLRSGEEELGHSLVAYAFACIPIEHKTNGGVSLFLFGPDNEFRLAVSQFVYEPAFEWFIMIGIIIASVLLGMSNPLDDPDSPKVQIMDMINKVLTSIFIFEMIVKVIALGFFFQPGSYLRDTWNWLDFLVVLVSMITDYSDIDLGFLTVFRTLRAIRPLRLLNRSANLKNTVYAMGQNVKAIINVGFLSLIILFIFSILSVQLFQGKFRSCSDPDILDINLCNGTWSDPNSESYPALVPRVFRTESRNFDDVAQALLTLFEISTGEAWSNILYRSYDACDEFSGPQTDCNVAQGFFFVFFFAVSGFFLMQLFVSFILHNYEQIQAQVTGANTMTEEQKIWVQTQQLLVNLRPYVAMVPHENEWSQYLFTKIVGSPYFDSGLATCICLDILTIAMDHYGIDAEFKSFLQIMNILFGVIFTMEACIKIFTFRLRYFKNASNLFDFTLVIIGLVGMGASDVQGVVVLRVFRMARLLRLVRSARGIQILLETLFYSIPQMANMSAFLIVITFSFAVLGVEMFAELYIPPDASSLDNNYANFRRLDTALMMLFRFLTFEDWVGVQRDTMIKYPKCEKSSSCGTPAAPLYFCAYIIITGFVILNLILAIILQNFELTMKLSGTEVKMGAFHAFVDIWSEYDENATMKLPTTLLPLLLRRLGPPIGISRKDSRNQIMIRLRNYFIPEHGGYIHFIEVLLALAQGSKKTDLSEYEQREYYERIRGSFEELLALPTFRHNNTTMTADLYFAQTFMAAAHRRNMFQVRDVHTIRAEKREKMRSACEKAKIACPEPYFIPHYELKIGSKKLLLVASSDGFGDLPLSILKQRPPYSTAPLQPGAFDEMDDAKNNKLRKLSGDSPLARKPNKDQSQHDANDPKLHAAAAGIDNDIPHLVIGDDEDNAENDIFAQFVPGGLDSPSDHASSDKKEDVATAGTDGKQQQQQEQQEQEAPVEPPVEIFKMADQIEKEQRRKRRNSQRKKKILPTGEIVSATDVEGENEETKENQQQQQKEQEQEQEQKQEQQQDDQENVETIKQQNENEEHQHQNQHQQHHPQEENQHHQHQNVASKNNETIATAHSNTNSQHRERAIVVVESQQQQQQHSTTSTTVENQNHQHQPVVVSSTAVSSAVGEEINVVAAATQENHHHHENQHHLVPSAVPEIQNHENQHHHEREFIPGAVVSSHEEEEEQNNTAAAISIQNNNDDENTLLLLRPSSGRGASTGNNNSNNSNAALGKPPTQQQQQPSGRAPVATAPTNSQRGSSSNTAAAASPGKKTPVSSTVASRQPTPKKASTTTTTGATTTGRKDQQQQKQEKAAAAPSSVQSQPAISKPAPAPAPAAIQQQQQSSPISTTSVEQQPTSTTNVVVASHSPASYSTPPPTTMKQQPVAVTTETQNNNNNNNIVAKSIVPPLAIAKDDHPETTTTHEEVKQQQQTTTTSPTEVPSKPAAAAVVLTSTHNVHSITSPKNLDHDALDDMLVASLQKQHSITRQQQQQTPPGGRRPGSANATPPPPPQQQQQQETATTAGPAATTNSSGEKKPPSAPIGIKKVKLVKRPGTAAAVAVSHEPQPASKQQQQVITTPSTTTTSAKPSTNQQVMDYSPRNGDFVVP